MKKVVISILIIFLFTSCEKEFYGYDEMGNKNTSTSKSTSTSTSSCSGKRTTSVQCSGTTKTGNRCQLKTLSCNGYCYLHGGN